MDSSKGDPVLDGVIGSVVATKAAVALPEVGAPSLENLAITVPAPAGITAEDVLLRLEELAHAHAEVREKRPMELVALGDLVRVDVVGYSMGKLIPFSVRADAWLRVEPDPALPTFFESLVGQPVGGSAVINLRLPEDYPAQALRGQPARFIVDLKGARELRLPALDNPAVLQALGLGATLDEALERVAGQLQAERAAALVAQARERVLDEVVARTQVALPERLVDEEIRRRWSDNEGRVLMDKKFSDAERQEALEGWLKDARTRQEASRRLKLALALRAICLRDNVAPSQRAVMELLERTAGIGGLTREQVAEALRGDAKSVERVEQVVWHLAAVEHVMVHAKIRFEGA